MATGPNDLQREAQLAFKRGKAADSMREHSDLVQAVVDAIREELGTPGRDDRIFSAFGALGDDLSDRREAGVAEAAAQVGAQINRVDDASS
jgi:hypothetical protein